MHKRMAQKLSTPCHVLTSTFQSEAIGFNPSSRDFASPSIFTAALPTITLAAPHPAIWNEQKKKELVTDLSNESI